MPFDEAKRAAVSLVAVHAPLQVGVGPVTELLANNACLRGWISSLLPSAAGQNKEPSCVKLSESWIIVSRNKKADRTAPPPNFTARTAKGRGREPAMAKVGFCIGNSSILGLPLTPRDVMDNHAAAALPASSIVVDVMAGQDQGREAVMADERHGSKVEVGAPVVAKVLV